MKDCIIFEEKQSILKVVLGLALMNHLVQDTCITENRIK